jgi:WD40 repeat protein/tRNA A-37 threonylcarbamoyl transferase component Bud32
MVCCLNPDCAYPDNSDRTDRCQTCGTPLITLLRNRYRPIQLLGQGGFGRTYLAEDSDRLNTRCVIKQFTHQPKGSKSFDKALQLFNQEAMRLNELGEHPQIPTLLAYFEHGGNLYLVQQVIEGHTLLAEVQKTGAFNEKKIRQVLTDLLPVLQFIHDHNVIHRDINPTNILRRSTDNKLVLIDFGIAKQLETSLVGETAGTRIGTEGYSPIEQLRSGEAYPSSDLYSLGATCLCILTACKPEKLYSALEGRWLWQEKLQELGRSISPQLAAILERMVKDLISERYPSATAVMQALTTLPSLPQSVPGWTRQHMDGEGLIAGKISDSFAKQSLFGPEQSSSGAGSRSGMPSNPVPPTQPPRVSNPLASANQQGAIPQQAVTISDRTSAGRGARASLSGGRTSSGYAATEPARWSLIKTFTGHTSWVSTVAFNPVLPMIASGGLDDIIRVWDLETGELTHSLAGHSRGINHLVFSPKGQVLASCSDDDTIRVWNLGTGKILHTLQGHRRDVTSLDIGSQGFLLVSGSEDCSIGLWKLDSGSLLKTLSSPNSGMIRCVAMTMDEQFVVSGGFDNKIWIWQLANGEVFKVLSGHLNSVNDVALSQNGRLIASASKDKTVRLWSLRSGNLIHALQGHTREVNSVALTPDQRTVVSASGDSTLKVWDTKTGELVETLMEHANSVTAVDIAASGEYMASASSDKTIKLWQRR